jgi:hypothetical protein
LQVRLGIQKKTPLFYVAELCVFYEREFLNLSSETQVSCVNEAPDHHNILTNPFNKKVSWVAAWRYLFKYNFFIDNYIYSNNVNFLFIFQTGYVYFVLEILQNHSKYLFTTNYYPQPCLKNSELASKAHTKKQVSTKSDKRWSLNWIRANKLIHNIIS